MNRLLSLRIGLATMTVRHDRIIVFWTAASRIAAFHPPAIPHFRQEPYKKRRASRCGSLIEAKRLSCGFFGGAGPRRHETALMPLTWKSQKKARILYHKNEQNA